VSWVRIPLATPYVHFRTPAPWAAEVRWTPGLSRHAGWDLEGRPIHSVWPNWLPIGLRSSATWRVLLLGAFVALLVDQALRVNALGLGAALALAAAAGGLWVSGAARSIQGRAVLVLAVAFGVRGVIARLAYARYRSSRRPNAHWLRGPTGQRR